ncbi:MAG TPA: bifunctional serine/threonine-protein kinase/formylglycine-generating enzyme family protein [Pyrinomonadaceae bacterium]|nr:bifunctional serine/threonine-protein kinase/formylglycine-generating enzyme family protein [Pyrinomonadaceae bacterium]
MFRKGDTIGPYTLIKYLGEGGFGVVWLAEWRTQILTTEVALKLPLKEGIDLEAIKREANIWAKASRRRHPNVLSIIEANIYGQYVVIASEYAPDGSLTDWLNRYVGKAPNIQSVIEIVDGILAGLVHLHSQKIIHRDLKPANILFQDETPRIADFGIARILISPEYKTKGMGSYAYMAPEAIDGIVTMQTDIWSVGVILYKLLTGRVPFLQKDTAALIHAISTRDPDPLPLSIPEQFHRVIRCALQRKPERRYKSAAEMREALINIRRQLYLADNRLSNSGLADSTTWSSPILYSQNVNSSDQEPFPSVSQSTDTSTLERKKDKLILSNLKRFKFDTVTVDSAGNITKRYTGRARYFVEALDGKIALEMVYVPGGAFLIGSPVSELNRSGSEGPQRQVTVPSLFISKYLVTQAQWRGVAGMPKVKRNLNHDPSLFKGDALPVERVSWKDAVEFCARLSKYTGKMYRLPTEAEWEFACRAGTTIPYAFGASITKDLANFGRILYSKTDPRFQVCTTEVGSTKTANKFGLYDMHGNVYEWCIDAWHENYIGLPNDGSAWVNGEQESRRIRRGGSWQSSETACRSAYRSMAKLNLRHETVGFRVALSV